MVPAATYCPLCHASAKAIRAWRAFAQIFYVCGQCEAQWTIDIDPPLQPSPPSDIISKLRFFKP
jgi:hypothetical protein